MFVLAKLDDLLAHCEGNPQVVNGFPSQRATNAEGILMSYSHYVLIAHYQGHQHDNLSLAVIKFVGYQWLDYLSSRGGHSHQLSYGGVPLYRVDFERPVSLK